MVSHYFRFMIYVTNVTVSLFIYALHHHQVTVQPHVHQLQGEQRGVKPTEYDVVQKQSHSCFLGANDCPGVFPFTLNRNHSYHYRLLDLAFFFISELKTSSLTQF